MSPTRILAAASCILPLLLASAALAADDIELELVAKVLEGEQPAVVLKVKRALASADLELTGDAGEKAQVHLGKVASGKTAKMFIDAPIGTTSFGGTLRVQFADGGTGEMPLRFAVEVVAPLEIEAPADRLDLERAQLQLRMSRPAGRCEYGIFSRGKRIQSGVARFAGEPAGTWLTVGWRKRRGAAVDRVRLDCFDQDGFSRGMELTPYDPPRISVPKDEVDVPAGRLRLTLSRPAARCRYGIAFDGAPSRTGTVEFAGEPAGTPLVVTWPMPDPEAVVLRIQLQCFDVTGSSAEMELFPWHLDIPHEDVTFETGRSEILAAEAPKLDRALDEIGTAVRRYGQVVDIKLYVIGYTDTVGSRASNQELSVARARSIAGYFRAHGVRVPIFYAGFGEDRLAVDTPDETDEFRNRRARYVIAVEAPESGAWKRL